MAVCSCTRGVSSTAPSPSIVALVAAAAIAKATAAMEEPANAADLQAALGRCEGRMDLMVTAVPVAARIMSDTLTEHGFSAAEFDPRGTVLSTVRPRSIHACANPLPWHPTRPGTLLFLRALRPHCARDPEVHTAATALAAKFLPAAMITNLLGAPAGAAAPAPAAAAVPAPSPAPAPPAGPTLTKEQAIGAWLDPGRVCLCP